jgi:parvulin-like peptidyl-prolyl isomerase
MGKGKGEGAPARSSGPAPRQRLGLLVFGVVFVVLFAGFAIEQGIGSPSIPSDAVAIVEDAPDGLGTVTKVEYDKALLQTATTAGLKTPPKPGDAKYEELKEATLGALLDTIWIQGQAAEMGITVTDKQLADEFKTIKSQNFKTEAEYQKFLKTSHLTQKDVDERVKLQVLSTEIQKRLGESPPKPSSAAVEDYYEAAKATQFTQKPTRDVRQVIAKDKAKAEKAKSLLEEDDAPGSWKKVAAKYSDDPASKTKGGLVTGLSEESTPEPIGAAVFAAQIGQVEGPLKGPSGYYVFEVQKSTPEKVQPLKEVQAQISAQLSQQAQQEMFSEFLAGYNGKWISRTFCAAAYTSSRCANFKAGGHPESAPPGCYEADPKGGLPEACPAPVQQLAPALPGTVSALSPKGTPLPQRPQPAGLESATEATLPGAIPGTVPGGATAPPPSE